MVKRRGYKKMERAPQTLVIDASVVAKWFIPEEDRAEALKLRNKHIEGSLTLIAPDLLVYEVANALSYHPELKNEDLKEDIEALFMIDLELVPPSTKLTTSIASKARQLGISVYDSSYLALAETIATNMVTADKKLYDKVKATGLVLILNELDRKWSI